MKIAFYMEDGLEQIVLTPDSDFEKQMLTKLHEKRELSIKRGAFYNCQGGWLRHGSGGGLSDIERTDDSTILVLRPIEASRKQLRERPLHERAT